MASIKKFLNKAVSDMLQHNNRERDSYSNPDIDPEREKLNYSFPMDHGKLSNFEYYKKISGEKYLYGRGSSREKDAVTAASWVVTLPKEIAGSPEKEQAFFKGVYDFVSDRYGKENIINNAVHYDEGGSPHIHILFVPSTKLDHDQVHFKTVKIKSVIQTETGRYEYSYRFKLDENGEKIVLKNYAKMSDYYDEKISANDVLNKAELQHFHNDLQKYLSNNGIEGTVVNGKTGGANFTVKELKEFTKNTGMTLDEVKEKLTEKTILESLVERDAKVQALEQLLIEKDLAIEQLKEKILTQNAEVTKAEIKAFSKELAAATEKNEKLQQKLSTVEKALSEKQAELNLARQRIRDLEKEKNVELSKSNMEQTWSSSDGWGNTSSGWGNNDKTINIGED